MRDHSVFRDGIVAGVIGATAVAVWFLAVDLIAGQALYTPEVLGRAFLSVLGPPFDDTTLAVVWVYTIIHYLGFIAIATLVAAIIHAGERQPALLAGALILFVAIEIGFYGLTALLAEFDALGTLAWYQIGAANLLAAVLMGTYFWRTHPALGRGLNYALEGGEEAARPAR